ncbi:hypothetical protein PM082_007799 [Marasmius tenuissimus]|nr:hypothetical protein PM082_007799 [Marasmius tenuissimus]
MELGLLFIEDPHLRDLSAASRALNKPLSRLAKQMDENSLNPEHASAIIPFNFKEFSDASPGSEASCLQHRARRLVEKKRNRGRGNIMYWTLPVPYGGPRQSQFSSTTIHNDINSTSWFPLPEPQYCFFMMQQLVNSLGIGRGRLSLCPPEQGFQIGHSGSYSAEMGDQVHYTTTVVQAKEKEPTEFNEYYRVKLGGICKLRDIGTYQDKGILWGVGLHAGRTYSGPDARRAFDEDFRGLMGILTSKVS